MAENVEVGNKVLIKCFHEPLECQEQQNLQPKEMHRVERRREWAFSKGQREHSWAERRELGLLSHWREWASTNLAPGVETEGVGPPEIESIGQKYDERSTSSPFPCLLDLPN